MNISSKRTFLQSALATAALATLSFAAMAQEGRPVPPDGGAPIGKAPTVPCCHCLGETPQAMPLHTGVATWTLVGGSVTTVTPHNQWDSLPSPSAWIGPNPSAGASAPGGLYTYQLRIAVPKCVIPTASITIRGQMLADDEGKISAGGSGGVTVSGGPFATSATPPGWGFKMSKVVPFTFNATAGGAGFVTLTAVVNNMGGLPSASGLQVYATLTKRCVGEGGGTGTVDPLIDKKD